ncbi:MAG: metal-dependent transcriptional regulator [Clostridiales bacterium]|nr:metal-dependent transcriptional regulator [Clostridia bacterium]MBR5366225.1 metal-dependent transcriptional regulator [Clostridia bacterium]MCR5681657.1 metal-dependent transcriptional regulator [Clostridiales bacterium]
MALQESGEMYLEAIYVLSQTKGFVRSVDVSEFRNYSKPSVSRAIGILQDGGYVIMGRDGGLTLTDAGREIAEKIYDRHTTMTKFFMLLGVDEAIATDDACRIEHCISDESFFALKNYVMHLEAEKKQA